MSYEISYLDTDFRLRNKNRITRWLDHCIRHEKKKSGEVHFIFCSEREILRINKEFLKHNYYTDIITFDYSSGKTLSAEIYVSPNTVRYNAVKLGVSFNNELKRVMVHGVLHLCGHNDKKPAQANTMRAKEDFYLLLWPQFKKA